MDNSDHTWAQLSCTDTKLKYYVGESCVRAFFKVFFITALCWKNVCDGRVEKCKLRI